MTVTEERANCDSQRRSDSSRSIPSRDFGPRGYLHESCLSRPRRHRIELKLLQDARSDSTSV